MGILTSTRRMGFEVGELVNQSAQNYPNWFYFDQFRPNFSDRYMLELKINQPDFKELDMCFDLFKPTQSNLVWLKLGEIKINKYTFYRPNLINDMISSV